MKVKDFANQYGIGSDDIKNLTIAALLNKMMSQSENSEDSTFLGNMLNLAKGMGLDSKKLS